MFAKGDHVRILDALDATKVSEITTVVGIDDNLALVQFPGTSGLLPFDAETGASNGTSYIERAV